MHLVLLSGACGILFSGREYPEGLPQLSPDVAVGCRIIDPPEVSPQFIRMIAEVNWVRSEAVSHTASGTLLISISRDSCGIPAAPPFGSIVEIQGRLSQPPETRNPGEVNLRAFYRIRGIDALMTARGASSLRIIDSSAGDPLYRYVVVPVRGYLLGTIDSTVGGEEGEFLKGLLIGVRSGLARETRSAFVASGVAHILAVSGSNVAVVASAFLFMLRILRVPPRWHLLPVTLVLVAYMLVTGSQAPVVRATVMAFAFLSARAAQRRTASLNAVGVAALLILGLDRWQLFDVGFQLSFAAVIALVVLYPRLMRLVPVGGRVPRFVRPLVQGVMVSVAAIVGTFPISAIWFGEVSVIGVLANLLVVPASGVSVVLGMVSAATGLWSQTVAGIIGAANWAILHWTLDVARILGGLPFASAGLYRFGLPEGIVFYAATVVVCFGHIRDAVRCAIPVGLLSANISLLLQEATVWSSLPAGVRVSVIDVGQGDAIVIQFHDGAVAMIDAGPAGPGYDAGERTLTPLLRRMGISRIHLLVVTHEHADHAGGLGSVVRQFAVDELWTPDTVLVPAAPAFPARIHHPRGGELRSPAEGARLFVLSPARDTEGYSASDPGNSLSNNRSIVVKLVYGKVSFIFMGDAEGAVEGRLVRVYGPFLRSDVLKVAHHGGNTGTTDGFLAAVQPHFAILSVGQFNRHGHPSEKVLERMQRRGVSVSRTDTDGAVVFETDGETLRRVLWREQRGIASPRAP